MGSGLFLILFFSVFLINLISATDPYFQFNCVDNGNFTANSTYGTNLNLLFSQLSTTADLNYGFYNLSVGRSPDQVNAIGLCRGDQKDDACRSCLNETITELDQRCPQYKEAIGWSEFCTLHYSSQQLFGPMESSPFSILYNVNNALDVDGFNQALSSLLNNLSSRAATGGPLLKYAADNTTGPGFFLTIYALEQCTPDLSQQDCSDCLRTAIGRISSGCYGKIGCRTLQPSCNLRYETSPFFAAVADIPQPPWPPSSPSPIEGNGNGSNTTRTIIITFVASVVGILSLVLCIWIPLRLKKRREFVETAEADEMIKAESLQYDLATVRAATTNNLCVENKLGQGGFGAVYKEQLIAEAIQKYGEDSNQWPKITDAQVLAHVLGRPSKDNGVYEMPMYMDPTEQGVLHYKHPPYTIPSDSFQSSQHVMQLQQTMTQLQENFSVTQQNLMTLQEKVERMERMFFLMQGGASNTSEGS